MTVMPNNFPEGMARIRRETGQLTSQLSDLVRGSTPTNGEVIADVVDQLEKKLTKLQQLLVNHLGPEFTILRKIFPEA
jgi:hypothetical protein